MHPRCSARTNAELQERATNQWVSSFITGLARIYGGYVFIYLRIYIIIYISHISYIYKYICNIYIYVIYIYISNII